MLRTDFPAPDFQSASGRFVRLERLNWSDHGDGLFGCLCGEGNDEIWRWLGNSGPYEASEESRFQDEFSVNQSSEMIPWQTVVIRDQVS